MLAGLTSTSPTATALREALDAPAPCTVGVEEELLLVDEAGRPLPAGPTVVAGAPGSAEEAVAVQVESKAGPAAAASALGGALLDGRRVLAVEASRWGGRIIGAGLPPLGGPLVAGNPAPRYDPLRASFGSVMGLQSTSGLHVHVRIQGAERTIAVHDALREELPALAALAANAPFVGGRDTTLASARPLVNGLLPRQGVPPVLGSVEALERELEWGREAGALTSDGRWWWELRVHPTLATLEVRVLDTQPTVAMAVALAGVVHALVADLADRHDADELPPPAPDWRIAENRWAALRGGLDAQLADVRTGARLGARAHVDRLLDRLDTAAGRVGASAALDAAADLLGPAGNGADRQRRTGSPEAAVEWLAAVALAS